MINDVKLKRLNPIPDERGCLTEILRKDDEIFQQFGQVYTTTAYPGVVKAWHYHKKQTDSFFVIKGMIKLVLFDSRKDSTTNGEINEFFVGDRNPLLIQIPPMVYHGFKCIGTEEGIMLNIPTEAYDRDNPDEFRIPPNSPDIPYEWERKDG